MAQRTPIKIDRQRIKELTETEQAVFAASTAASGRLYERAGKVLAAGVASSYQLMEPWPIYFERLRSPAWLVIVLLTADAIVGLVRRAERDDR